LLLTPDWAIPVGGLFGVLAGVLFFRGSRAFAARAAGQGLSRGAVIGGLAWRLGAVILVAGLLGWAGGSAGAGGFLGGLLLARLVIRRRTG
jgi:membrane associated rhomboid family serine protease